MSATIIWFATIQHVFWGLLLLSGPAALGATALTAFAGLPPLLVAACLFGAACLAAIGLTRPVPSWRSLVMVLPQQSILVVSAVTAILAIATGRYGDGVQRPQAFIAADQLPVVLLMVLYTVAVVELHFPARSHQRRLT